MNGEVPESPLVGIALDLFEGDVSAELSCIGPELAEPFVPEILGAAGALDPWEVHLADHLTQHTPGVLVRAEEILRAPIVSQPVRQAPVLGCLRARQHALIVARR